MTVRHDASAFTVLGRLLVLGALTLGIGASPSGAQAKTFVFANGSLYDNMDPHQVFDVARVATRLNLYDGLYRWQDNPPKLEPWLAESHAISADGTVYTFKLKSNTKFHDGTELTADDVVYSVERLLAMGKGAAPLVSTMLAPGNTRAVDRHTVAFKLKSPTATFLSVVPEISIVNAALVKKNEKGGDWGAAWLTSNEAGSGAYMMTRFDPAVGFMARRFKDHFYGWGDKHLDEIEFRAVVEPSTQVQGLIRGDFHGLDSFLPVEQIKRLQSSANVKVLEAESMRIAVINMNNTKAPFNDVHFRKAVSHAFNYDGMINGVLGGSVQRNPSPTPNNMWGAPPNVRGYTFDLAKAREERAKAGTKADRRLVIAFSTGQVINQQMAEVLQAGLKEIGIDTEMRVMPWANLQPLFRAPETSPDMFVAVISTYYPDPHNWIGEMYSSANWGTFKSASYYKNPEVDRLLDVGLTSTDPNVRRKAYEDAGSLVVADAASVFVHNSKWFGPYAKDVEGIRFCPIGNGQEMRWVHFK